MFCVCENKDADQLRGNREADQRLRLRYNASTFLKFHALDNSLVIIHSNKYVLKKTN